MKLFKYWVSNLTTDKGQYVANGEELDRLVRQWVMAGVALTDIGIHLEEPND